VVHAFRPDGSELPGWPVRSDRLPLHLRGRAFRSQSVSRRFGGAFLSTLAAGDIDRDGTYEVVGADYEGKVYVWNAKGKRVFTRAANPRFSGAPLKPFVNERKGKRNRTQHGFIASPVLADIDQNDGGKLEIVAAAMDRHLYAWENSGRLKRGYPTIVVDRSKVASIDPRSHQVRFNDRAGDELNQGAIIDTPAVGDIIGDRRPEIVLGTNEEYAADAPGEGGINAAVRNTASLAAVEQTGVLDFGNGRLYALNPDGDKDGDFMRGPTPFATGWPVKVGKLFTELLPVVGEGITGAPVIGPVNCPNGGDGPKVGAMPDAGVSYIFTGVGESCYGRDGGKDVALQSDFAVTSEKTDAFAYSAVGHPAFGNFAGGISFLAPTVGIKRALDLAVNEYQGGQDYLGAWDATTGQFRPNFPGLVNDLQFLSGPSIGDIDGQPGEEMVAGTAHLDLQAYNGSGNDATPNWPKLTSDWTVSNAALGSFGSLDTSPDARKRVITVTRAGALLAYGTEAPACSPGSWPRFHHDNANSGDYRRDAVDPGRPTGLGVSGGALQVTAPGDDLMCGTVKRYEIVHAGDKPDPRSLAEESEPIDAPAPVAPGQTQSIPLPANLNAYVGIRAVDDQGNVGPLAVVRTGRPARRVKPQLRISATPKKAKHGQATRFRFRATAVVHRKKRAVRKAKIRFAGRTLRTDRKGRASLVRSLPAGRYEVTVTRGGYRPAKLTLVVK
jgi:hypothetical protein